MDGRHTVACFLRVDLGVAGDPDSDRYQELSEQVQDLLEEALDRISATVELRAMTCRVLGPVDGLEELSAAQPGEEFDPLLALLEDEAE